MSKLTEKQLNKVKKFLENKTFTFEGPLLYDSDIKSKFDFKLELKGYRKMISVGETYDYLIVGVTIIKLKDSISKLLMGNLYGDYSKMFKNNLYFLYKKLNSYIRDTLVYFDPDIRITIDEFNVMVEDTDKDVNIEINEQKKTIKTKMSDLAIRTVVKDVLKILKSESAGQYSLPNEYGGEYSFKNLPFSFSVELHLFQDKGINTFSVDGNWYGDEDVMELILSYNPKNLIGNLYNIVGELNEVIAHELTHGKQNLKEGLSDVNQNLTPLEYYTQHREIEAQKAGFKRLSKLKGEPYIKIVKEWFNNHNNVHGLTDTEVKRVIKLLR